MKQLRNFRQTCATKVESTYTAGHKIFWPVEEWCSKTMQGRQSKQLKLCSGSDGGQNSTNSYCISPPVAWGHETHTTAMVNYIKIECKSVNFPTDRRTTGARETIAPSLFQVGGKQCCLPPHFSCPCIKNCWCSCFALHYIKAYSKKCLAF